MVNQSTTYLYPQLQTYFFKYDINNDRNTHKTQIHHDAIPCNDIYGMGTECCSYISA